MELEEVEENNRKRLAEATLQEFELLDDVSKVSHSGTIARSAMRSEKVVLDWINTSLALSFNNEEKTAEPEVTKDPPGSLATITMKQWNITTLNFQGIPFKKVVHAITILAMRPCSNSTLIISQLKIF